MRYEAKHNHLKKLAQNIGNFINIAWTLASRHQYWQCYKWQEGDVMDDEPEIGPGTYTVVRIPDEYPRALKHNSHIVLRIYGIYYLKYFRTA